MNPLTGVLTCDNCREPFLGAAQRLGLKTYLRMWHSLRRCSMIPVSVNTSSVEEEFAERVLDCIELDDGWRDAVLRAMVNEGPRPDHTLETKRIQSAIANLRKQHLWSAIDDDGFKEEFQALERQRKSLAPMPQPHVMPNMERAAELLQNLPALWQHPGTTPEQRRELVREVFQEARLRQGSISAPAHPEPVEGHERALRRALLPHWPQTTTPQHMQVQMRNFLPRVRPLVDHQPVSRPCQTLALGHLPCHKDQVPQQSLPVLGKRREVRHMLRWNHQEMSGCLGVDIPYDEGQVVAVQKPAGYLPPSDFTKYAVLSHILRVPFLSDCSPWACLRVMVNLSKHEQCTTTHSW